MNILIFILLCLISAFILPYFSAKLAVYRIKRENKLIKERIKLHKIAEKLNNYMTSGHLTAGEISHDIFCKIVFKAENKKNYITILDVFRVLLLNKRNSEKYRQIDAQIDREFKDKPKKLQELKNDFENCLSELIYYKHFKLVLFIIPFYLLQRIVRRIRSTINKHIISISYKEVLSFTKCTFSCSHIFADEKIVEYAN